MRLSAVVDEIAMECDLEKSTIQQYRRSVQKFSEHLEKVATEEDLTPANVNRFVANLQQEITNTTAGNYRRALCRVWNYLTETQGVEAYEIKRLRRPKNEERPVFAWSLHDIALLTEAAKSLQGTLRIGVPAAAYFEAWLWAAYDTGLRPSDLWLIRWDQIDFEGKTIALTQHKTAKPHVAFLSDETCDLILKIRDPARPEIFPLKWGGLRKWALKIFAIAKPKGFNRLPGQSLGNLRKVNATQTFIDHGASAAAQSLGHSGGERTVWKHYIDSRARRPFVLPRRPNEPRSS